MACVAHISAMHILVHWACTAVSPLAYGPEPYNKPSNTVLQRACPATIQTALFLQPACRRTSCHVDTKVRFRDIAEMPGMQLTRWCGCMCLKAIWQA